MTINKLNKTQINPGIRPVYQSRRCSNEEVGGVGLGGQGGWERRIEAFVKIKKKKIYIFFLGGGGGGASGGGGGSGWL